MRHNPRYVPGEGRRHNNCSHVTQAPTPPPRTRGLPAHGGRLAPTHLYGMAVPRAEGSRGVVARDFVPASSASGGPGRGGESSADPGTRNRPPAEAAAAPRGEQGARQPRRRVTARHDRPGHPSGAGGRAGPAHAPRARATPPGRGTIRVLAKARQGREALAAQMLDAAAVLASAEAVGGAVVQGQAVYVVDAVHHCPNGWGSLALSA